MNLYEPKEDKMGEFQAMIGGTAVLCYALSIIFDNAGLGCLALGLTIYAMNN